MLIDFIGISEC